MLTCQHVTESSCSACVDADVQTNYVQLQSKQILNVKETLHLIHNKYTLSGRHPVV